MDEFYVSNSRVKPPVKQDFYIVNDIFTNQVRKKMIKDVNPLLLTSEQMKRVANCPDKWHPGRQTVNTLYNQPTFKPQIEFLINVAQEVTQLKFGLHGAWVNWTNGKKKDINWHIHPCDYTLCYYMKIFPFFSNGTLYENGFIKAKQNSFLLSRGYLKHTAPTSPLRFGRYTLVLDLGVLK